jgi:hypothetical protein
MAPHGPGSSANGALQPAKLLFPLKKSQVIDNGYHLLSI